MLLKVIINGENSQAIHDAVYNEVKSRIIDESTVRAFDSLLDLGLNTKAWSTFKRPKELDSIDSYAIEPLINALTLDLKSFSLRLLLLIPMIGGAALQPLISFIKKNYNKAISEGAGGARELLDNIRNINQRDLGYVINLLNDDNKLIREIGIIKLRYIKNIKAVEALLNCLTGSTTYASRLAVNSLKYLTGKSFLFGKYNKAKWEKWWHQKKNCYIESWANLDNKSVL